ncbi:hypothetical protein DV738_g1286, partial [Chaetothyriales sp. CBS 135597]
MSAFTRPAVRVAGIGATALVLGYGVSHYYLGRDTLALSTAHAESVSSDAKGPKVLAWKGFTELKLESAETVNHNVKRLTFALPDKDSVTGLAPVTSLLTQHTPEGAFIPVFRPYTPISANDEPGHVTFLVKRYPGGKGSGKMHSLVPGDTIKFKPLHEFDYKPNQYSHLTLIAGGSGITPIYQLTNAILSNPEDKTRITLLYANNTEEDILLRHEFDALERKFPGRFHKVFTVKQKTSGDSSPAVETGYITKELLQKVVPARGKDERVKVLVSGPPPMTESIAGAKGGFGWTQGSLGGILKELGYKSEEPKFQFTLRIIDLTNIPLVCGTAYVKWHLPMSSAAEHRGKTEKAYIHDHRAVWEYVKETPVRMTIEKHQALQECEIHFEIVQEYSATGRGSRVQLGNVKLNLAEYTRGPEVIVNQDEIDDGFVTRRYLLQDSKVNCTLKVGIKLEQTEGDTNFIAPPLKAAMVNTGIAGVLSTEIGEGDDIPSITTKTRELTEAQDLYRRTLAATWACQHGEMAPDQLIEDLFAGGDGGRLEPPKTLQDIKLADSPYIHSHDESLHSSSSDNESKRTVTPGHHRTPSTPKHSHRRADSSEILHPPPSLSTIGTGLLLVLFSLLLPLILGAAPTWPYPASDELEDIIFLHTGYRAREFAAPVTPCSVGGASRRIAAEWLRTSFHDMATANVFQGTGGIDASLVYELNNGENVGTGFDTALATFEPYMSVRASLADLIAIGTYTSVRSCGGRPIPIRPGRIDATRAGALGVPQPQNAISIFRNQFSRMGFNSTEMIMLVACGHSLGGVHAENNPLIVAPDTVPNDYALFDSTNSTFDEKIATEYLDGSTTNPLVRGLSVRYSRNSDFVVFSSDRNATISQLANPEYFQATCQSVLQRMIEIVPANVTLGADPIEPYEARPYGLQLYLTDDSGSSLTFSGDIRIRTTSRSPSSVTVIYTDRNGESSCGTSCSISTTYAGAANGFDDSFSFYSFSTTIPASTSISSFIISITDSGGSTETLDNNGSGFPVQDSVLLQLPQSCSASSSLTVTAAVRNTTSDTPVLNVIGRAYRAGIIVPTFNITSSPLIATGQSVSDYTLYNLTLLLNTTQAATARYNVSLSSTLAVDYQAVSGLSTTCSPLPTANSTNPPETNYTFLGCVTDPIDPRALSNAYYHSSTDMTTESCAASCSSYAFFGTEYSAECFCGNTLAAGSTNASSSAECNMPCTGDSTQTCGGPSRLSLYQNTAYTPLQSPSFSGYTYQGCYTDSVDNRTLTAARTDSSTAMTIQLS